MVLQTMNKPIKYRVFQQRLSEENINWLKKERKEFDSWNLLFNDIKKRIKTSS